MPETLEPNSSNSFEFSLPERILGPISVNAVKTSVLANKLQFLYQTMSGRTVSGLVVAALLEFQISS